MCTVYSSSSFPFFAQTNLHHCRYVNRQTNNSAGHPHNRPAKRTAVLICRRGQTKLGVCFMRPKENVWWKGIQSGTGTHRGTHTVAFSLPCVRTKHRICTDEWHIFAIVGTTSFSHHPWSEASEHISCQHDGQSCAGGTTCISCTLTLPWLMYGPHPWVHTLRYLFGTVVPAQMYSLKKLRGSASTRRTWMTHRYV